MAAIDTNTNSPPIETELSNVQIRIGDLEVSLRKTILDIAETWKKITNAEKKANDDGDFSIVGVYHDEMEKLTETKLKLESKIDRLFHIENDLHLKMCGL